MKIEQQNLDDHQVKLVVEADEQELNTAKRKAARAIAKRVKIPGFRPGKAPFNVVERQVGAGAILEDALEILAQDLYPKAIDEAGIKPYGPGSLESIANVEPPTFEFVVPLQAEIELGEYLSIKIPYKPEEVSEEEIENALRDLRDRHAVIEPVDRSAQEGDLVRIQLKADRLEPEEGQDPVLINPRALPIIIEDEDADTENEWPFPGFSRQLLGMGNGDEKELEHTFSDESPYESLRGTKARFHVQVEQVSSRELPALEDEFALTVSEYETIEELREAIREELQDSKLGSYHREYDDQIIDKVVDDARILYPPQMVDRELEDMLYDLRNRLAQQGLDFETYLRINQKTEEEIREEFRETAEKRLRRSLALFELARSEEIEVNQQEVQTETLRTLDALRQALSQEELQKITAQEQMQNLISNIMADMLVNKTVEHMRTLVSDEKFSPSAPEVVEAEETTTNEQPSEVGETVVEAVIEAAVEEAESQTQETTESPAKDKGKSEVNDDAQTEDNPGELEEEKE